MTDNTDLNIRQMLILVKVIILRDMHQIDTNHKHQLDTLPKIFTLNKDNHISHKSQI